MIPIEIVNKILIYTGELNNNIIITQYNPFTNKEYYKINFHSNSLWKINAVLTMKQLYPIRGYNFFSKKANMELYHSGIEHYEKVYKFSNWNYGQTYPSIYKSKKGLKEAPA